MILGRFKVSGHSMEPYLHGGDEVIAVGFLRIKIGDVVVIKHNSKYLIKRITRIADGEVFLEGDNEKDSLKIGEVSKNDIIGKVVLKL